MPSPQIRDPMHMHIDPYSLRTSPRGAQAQVGHFGTDAREAHQAFYGVWDVAIEGVAQNDGGGFDVAGFVVVEADDVDELVEADGIDGEDVFECEAGVWQFSLEAAHGDCVGGVFCLGGEH